MPHTRSSKRILFAHYRVGMTDGVSLEIDKRRHLLEMQGNTVSTMAGAGSAGADYVAPAMDFDTDAAQSIARKAFGCTITGLDAQNLMEDIRVLARKVEEEVEEVIRQFRPDFIFLHNVFSHGRHIAAAAAFREVLMRHGIPALATHHDFYWERDRYQQPSCPSVKAYLDANVPPVIPGLKHAVINTLAAGELKERTGIFAMVFPDTLDFDAPKWTKDDWNRQLPPDAGFSTDDIIILQATRIVPRKGIELMAPLFRRLNSAVNLRRVRNTTLYNGKKTSTRSRFKFIVAGYAEDEARWYEDSLKSLFTAEDVCHRFIARLVAARRGGGNAHRVYSLFDVYPFADIVSYPSLYEGWGNQFLEAVFAAKPVVLFEYPVFQADIKSKGYTVISMGDRVEKIRNSPLHTLPEETINRVADEIITALLDPKTNEVLNENFRIGRANNSYGVLEDLLARGMAS